MARTLTTEGDRELRLATALLLVVAVGTAGGHLQRAKALAAVRLRAGEPHALLACVVVGFVAALAQVARNLVGGHSVFGQPASPFGMQLRQWAALQAPAEARVPALTLGQPLLNRLVLLVRLAAEAHVKVLSEPLQPTRASLESAGHIVPVQLRHRLLHHHLQDVASHLQSLAPLLAVKGVHLGLGHGERTDSAFAKRAPASGTR
eukprot:4854605-Prymnesium_polylepis.1